MWGEEDHPALLPKTKGSGVMVSDFVDQHTGYLTLTPEQHDAAKTKFPSIPSLARVLFEYGAERGGYWTSDKFMQ